MTASNPLSDGLVPLYCVSLVALRVTFKPAAINAFLRLLVFAFITSQINNTFLPPPSLQLSVATGALYLTTAPQIPGSVFTEIFAGQVITGGWVSFTVTVNEQVAVFPLTSFAVTVTVVVPT